MRGPVADPDPDGADSIAEAPLIITPMPKNGTANVNVDGNDVSNSSHFASGVPSNNGEYTYRTVPYAGSTTYGKFVARTA